MSNLFGHAVLIWIPFVLCVKSLWSCCLNLKPVRPLCQISLVMLSKSGSRSSSVSNLFGHAVLIWIPFVLCVKSLWSCCLNLKPVRPLCQISLVMLSKSGAPLPGQNPLPFSVLGGRLTASPSALLFAILSLASENIVVWAVLKNRGCQVQVVFILGPEKKIFICCILFRAELAIR